MLIASEIGSVGRLVALGALLLASLVVTTIGHAAQPPSLEGKALVEALRAGGYNIYFRHVATDWSQSDDVGSRNDWLDCDPARMRQLSDAGRDAAVAIGNAMRRLKIPVFEVLASPYCRTQETARLMAVGPVEASTDVMNLRAAQYFGGRAAIVASARQLLASAPQPGSNRVIVAHGNVARERAWFSNRVTTASFTWLAVSSRNSGRACWSWPLPDTD
jgi:hypothetical protein